MARQVKPRRGGKSGTEPGHVWSRWVGGLLAAAAVAFIAGIGVGIMLGDNEAGMAARAPAPMPPAARSVARQTAPVISPAAPSKVPTTTVVHAAPARARVSMAPVNPNRITLAPAPRPRARRVWDQNAVAYSVPPGTPLIAIVLDDMGLDRRRSERATRLTAPLTLSYLSYANDLVAQTGAARARGHELMLHIPMEPEGEADPGPGALLLKLSDSELRERIDFALGRFPGFVAVNNHMGSRYTADRARMALVFEAIRGSGHLFLDSLTTPHAVALSLGLEM
ncbi:MAG: divergent polysaccharide deacetylase family protein, partial [Alphaproteobacteria bacterium]|nr:divergent polysaccharide deacetylase family protein [Alphaproteobacteria bacterium]